MYPSVPPIVFGIGAVQLITLKKISCRVLLHPIYQGYLPYPGRGRELQASHRVTHYNPGGHAIFTKCGCGVTNYRSGSSRGACRRTWTLSTSISNSNREFLSMDYYKLLAVSSRARADDRSRLYLHSPIVTATEVLVPWIILLACRA